jgi:hypothetical protein
MIGSGDPAHQAAGMVLVRMSNIVIYCCHVFLLDTIF